MTYSAPRTVSIFGATGSVGKSTLDLIRLDRQSYRILALTANGNAKELAKLAREFDAEVAVIADAGQYDALKDLLAGTNIEVAAGPESLIAAAALGADWTMAAIVGCAGLPPTLAALKCGKTVALANKEALVSAGHLMMAQARDAGAVLLPVDSEHNAIFQCLQGGRIDQVRKITLTASGGPFRTWTKEQMASVTPAQAVAHPNWDMGAKISVDSATMMNKGLELIEAHHLFPVGLENIDILVHPQSVIHSMVEYHDCSTLAQLGSPDMRIPIASALAWPERMTTNCVPLDLAKIGRLDFEAPDYDRFPAIQLARHAIEAGGAVPAILNAANEVAVAAFLKGDVQFLEITKIVSRIIDSYSPPEPNDLTDIFGIDKETRKRAIAMIEDARV
ncbi:MAG: 1-deoxy-D-xylulose-5-phosphate reductoisomerase [Parasphingorhabdus sp.]